MPMYIYICKKCGKTKEILRTVKEVSDEVKCECGEKMQIKIGKTNFRIS